MVSRVVSCVWGGTTQLHQHQRITILMLMLCKVAGSCKHVLKLSRYHAKLLHVVSIGFDADVHGVRRRGERDGDATNVQPYGDFGVSKRNALVRHRQFLAREADDLPSLRSNKPGVFWAPVGACHAIGHRVEFLSRNKFVN